MARKNYQVEHLEREVKFLREQIAKMHEDPGDLPVTGCGDGSCIVAHPTGMHTNGGCRCNEFTLRRAMMYWRRRSEFLQETVRLMKEEVHHRTFEEAWAAKVAEGCQYGEDALEQVRFGWNLAKGEDK